MNERDLLFIGGGHAHALAIRTLAMKPIKGVRVTLVSEQTLTPYSGMLPGFVAGHYSYEDAHIDLNRLCAWANVRYIKGRVFGLDLQSKTAQVESTEGAGHFECAYDIVSVDIGSTPDTSVAGAARFAVGVKPVSQFAATWNALLEESRRNNSGHWGVIGAGAGGVELVLGMAHRVNQLNYHLVYPHKHVLPGYPEKLVETVERKLINAGITLHPEFRVSEVNERGLRAVSDKALVLDQSIWCTGASAAPWPQQAGLQTSDRGFIAVDEYLRSCSHPEVFAVGDCADMLHDPRPKAGVYAVRQAPYLVENLRMAFHQGNGKAINLQSDFLSLISLGEKSAVGCRNGMVVSGRWVWRLKDYIDTKFMRRLNQPGEKPAMGSADDVPMQCAGCGSKLGPELLHANLTGLPFFQNQSVKPALQQSEDASLWTVSEGKVAVQSIDGFRSFSQDHWRFGKICVNHALSDIYAMGARPVCAQVWINVAFAHPRLQKRDHRLLMSGIAEALKQQEVVLSGGHSTEGMEDHIAIVANGEISESTQWKKNTPREGDALILTKPIGTGVVLAADMQATAPADAIDAAIDAMLLSNRNAARLLADLTPSAVTDVTGFGLLGHLIEMMENDAHSLGARIDLQQVPLLRGALALSRRGVRSTLYPQLQPLLHQCELTSSIESARVDLLLDPQTSGGLLISMPLDAAHQFIERFDDHAVVIGKVGESSVRVSIH